MKTWEKQPLALKASSLMWQGQAYSPASTSEAEACPLPGGFALAMAVGGDAHTLTESESTHLGNGKPTGGRYFELKSVRWKEKYNDGNSDMRQGFQESGKHWPIASVAFPCVTFTLQLIRSLVLLS